MRPPLTHQDLVEFRIHKIPNWEKHDYYLKHCKWEELKDLTNHQWIQNFIHSKTPEALGKLDDLYGLSGFKTGNQILCHLKGKNYIYRIVFSDYGQHCTKTCVFSWKFDKEYLNFIKQSSIPTNQKNEIINHYLYD